MITIKKNYSLMGCSYPSSDTLDLGSIWYLDDRRSMLHLFIHQNFGDAAVRVVRRHCSRTECPQFKVCHYKKKLSSCDSLTHFNDKMDTARESFTDEVKLRRRAWAYTIDGPKRFTL